GRAVRRLARWTGPAARPGHRLGHHPARDLGDGVAGAWALGATALRRVRTGLPGRPVPRAHAGGLVRGRTGAQWHGVQRAAGGRAVLRGRQPPAADAGPPQLTATGAA